MKAAMQAHNSSYLGILLHDSRCFKISLVSTQMACKRTREVYLSLFRLNSCILKWIENIFVTIIKLVRIYMAVGDISKKCTTMETCKSKFNCKPLP